MKNRDFNNSSIKITPQNTILHIIGGPDQWGITAGYHNAYATKTSADQIDLGSIPTFCVQPTFLAKDPLSTTSFSTFTIDESFNLRIVPTSLSYRNRGEFQLIQGFLARKAAAAQHTQMPQLLTPIMKLFEAQSLVKLLYHPFSDRCPRGVIMTCTRPNQATHSFQIPQLYTKILDRTNELPPSCEEKDNVRLYEIQRKFPKKPN